MFWNKKPKPAPEPIYKPAASELEVKPEPQKTEAELLQEAANSLTATLWTYSEAAKRAQKSEPEPEVQAAHNKIAAALQIVEGGGLAEALGTTIPNYLNNWSLWRTEQPTIEDIGFEASAFSAVQRKEKAGDTTLKLSILHFTFNNTDYVLTLTEPPYSSDRDREIELVAGGKRVAKFGLKWDMVTKFSDIRAFSVGPWMKDILDIEAQINASVERRLSEFSNQRAVATAKEIDLSSETS